MTAQRETPAFFRRLFSPQSAMAALAQASASVGRLEQGLDLLVDRLIFSDNKTLRTYEPTEADVFVATFAKSGTNWAMHICLQIAHLGAADFDHIHDLVAWPEGPFREIVALDDPAPREAAPTRMRVIKSHLVAGVVPYSPRARYVTIVRDPKEVLVSAYYFLLGQLGVLNRVSPAAWFELALRDDRFPYAWARHTAAYWAWREKPNVDLRLFSQLKADHAGAVRELAALMGVDFAPEVFDAVMHKSTFAYMKARDDAFTPPRSPLVPSDQHPSMMRRGESGNASELVTDALGARIDAACRRVLARFGSDFPYDEAFSPV